MIEETIHEKLPGRISAGGILLEHGMIDQVVPRAELRATLGRILGLLREPEAVGEMPCRPPRRGRTPRGRVSPAEQRPGSRTARPSAPKLIDLSLGRIERLLAALGDPQEKLPPVVHVAGTKGKGSTVATMRACLEAGRYRVHAYTSPHLVRFHERIRRPGRLIDEEGLIGFSRNAAANGDAPITFFEITTAAAFLAFARTPADIVLLEVGLGGRLDATNVVRRPGGDRDHPGFARSSGIPRRHRRRDRR